MRYRVYLTTGASLSVTVDVPDDLAEDDAIEAAYDAAYEKAPSLCEFGDWEIERDAQGQEIRPERVDGAS